MLVAFVSQLIPENLKIATIIRVMTVGLVMNAMGLGGKNLNYSSTFSFEKYYLVIWLLLAGKNKNQKTKQEKSSFKCSSSRTNILIILRWD